MAERYDIKGRIGQGGVGAVYDAYDTVLNRRVAIKRLLPDDESEVAEGGIGTDLAKEAAILSSLHHPNIITLYDIAQDEEGAFVVMNGPIVGYVGSLTTLRLDIQLLEFIACKRPQWQLVLVGPQDEEFKASALHQMNNVHFLGNKRPDQLPAYIKGFDVAINPQAINDITIGNYPRKIDEYLAMGKPIVATKTVAMEMFSEHVYLAKTHDDYVQMIELALSEDARKHYRQRIAFAQSHTWENNVAAIYQAIDQSLKNKATCN